MQFYPVFLSVVIVIRNDAKNIEQMLREAGDVVTPIASEYEIIVVDNASEDDSVAILKGLTSEDGLANLQIFALAKEVDADTAAWVGLENALGDFIAVIDPSMEDIKFLPNLLEEAVNGADVVFADNEQKPPRSLSYKFAFTLFTFLYKIFNGSDLNDEVPQYRMLSKRVVNFILQYPQPAMTYRHLPATGGFARVNLNYSAKPKADKIKNLGSSIDRGSKLLVSTTRFPMRLVTSLSLFGAGANLVYSFYVVAVGLFKTDVAAGWVSLSLQQSGMFFLISLVLMVLGEYILNVASLSNEGPLYYVGQEFTSARMTRFEELNIEEVDSSSSPINATST